MMSLSKAIPRFGLPFALAVLVMLADARAQDAGAPPPDAPAADAAAPIELRANWLDGTESLTSERFERLAALAAVDPETKALLDQAVGKVGGRSAVDILKYVCVYAKPKSPREYVPAGRAQPGILHQQYTYPLLEDLAAGKAADEMYGKSIQRIEREMKAFETKKELKRDYARVIGWSDFTICMRSDLTIAGAFETLIHELTHVFVTDRLAETDILGFESEEDYMLKTILSPGDEVDAFIAGYRAQIRLEKSRAGVPLSLRSFFNDRGDFVGDRLLLAGVILAAGPGGFNYAGEARFRSPKYYPKTSSEYAERLLKSHDYELSLRNQLTDAPNSRAKQEEIHRQNVEVARSNIRVFKNRVRRARQAGDAEAEKQARSDLGAEKKELENYERLADAARDSYQRLRADIAVRDERIKRYRKKIADWKESVRRAAPPEEPVADGGVPIAVDGGVGP